LVRKRSAGSSMRRPSRVSSSSPARCGRPLGMAFTKAGQLLVCDAILGLYMLHLEEAAVGEVQRTMLLPTDMEIQGKQHMVYNSIAISEDDQTVYLTVSSTRSGLLLLLLLLVLSPLLLLLCLLFLLLKVPP